MKSVQLLDGRHARQMHQVSAALAQRVEAVLARMVALMPPDLQAATLVARQTLPTLRVRVAPNKDENAYMAFDTEGGGPYSIMDLFLGCSDEDVAHEVGHYLTHILAGNAKFRAIAQVAPDIHGVGDLHSLRRTICEDYAYYNQFALTGTLNGGDVASGAWVGRLKGGKQLPKDIDYPSIEGFACALMAGMTVATKYDFTNKAVAFDTTSGADVPGVALVTGADRSVGISRGEIYRAFKSGATNIRELLPALQGLLTNDKQRLKFQAMAEQMGWSYHGVGVVQDKNGNKLAGAELYPKLMDGQNMAFRLFTVNTDLDGKFELKRAYPGSYVLSVKTFYDKFDVPFTTNWDRATTDPELFLTLRAPSAVPTELRGVFRGGNGLTAPFTVRSLEGVYVSRDGAEPAVNLASSRFSIQLDAEPSGKPGFRAERLLTRHDNKILRKRVEQSGRWNERLDFRGADFGAGGLVHLDLEGTYTPPGGASTKMNLSVGKVRVTQSVHTDREKGL